MPSLETVRLSEGVSPSFFNAGFRIRSRSIKLKPEPRGENWFGEQQSAWAAPSKKFLLTKGEAPNFGAFVNLFMKKYS